MRARDVDMHVRWTAAVLVTCAMSVGGMPTDARAYTVKNLLSRGCHEEITTAALRTVRADLATAAPLPASEDDRALIGDLQFTPDADMMDLAGATLLVAVRDNDLKGRSSEDLTQLAGVHGNPDGQQEHCLRREGDDEPSGSEAAVAACRDFIRTRILEALDGLDAAGAPDASRRTTLSVHLSLRGQVDAPLPTYFVKIGQALHAIEDSFTHTYRTPDEKKITVVLNWIEKVNGTLVESRDGPAHASQLDRCDDPDALRTTRHALAIDAVVGVLRGTLDPRKTPDQKMAAADAVLDEYLSYSPGCTPANGWCDAAERGYGDTSNCGCHAGKIGGGLGAVVAAGVAAALAVARRRRRRSKKGAAAAAALAIAILLALAPHDARAQSTPPAAEEHAPPPPRVVPVLEPGPRDPNATAWGAALTGSGSYDNPALAGSIGGRLHWRKHWSFGLDAEWNPWLAFNGSLVHAGTINVFGSAMLRFPLAYENFNLRTTVSLGASYLLSNLYGAPSGSVGPYAGVSFLGLEWKLSRTFWLVINPLNIALPVPQTRGVPLAYPQYRFTLGLEIYFG